MSFGENKFKLKKKKINKFNSYFNKYYFSNQINLYETDNLNNDNNTNDNNNYDNNNYIVSYILIFISVTLTYLFFSYSISYYFNNIYIDILDEIAKLLNPQHLSPTNILQKVNSSELDKINLFKFLNIIS